MPRMAGASAFATFAASILVLTGCATPERPKPLTPEELAAFHEQQSDLDWESTGLEDELRPTVALGDYVAIEEFDNALGECLTERGADDADFELILYACRRLHLLAPSAQGYFSGAEREAIYDYYQKSLVPCLGVHGVELQSAPQRWQAEDGPGWVDWNPYWALQRLPGDFSDVEDDCPILPDWAEAH